MNQKKITIFARIQFLFRLFIVIILSIFYALRVIVTKFLGFDKSKHHQHTRNWAIKVLKVCKIQIDIFGYENLDKTQSYIYVSNHSSLFDIPVILASVKDNVRIIYKKELEKIPIFGWGLAVSPYIAIQRADPRNALSSLDEAIKSIKEGDSVLVYPEGTRSRDGKLQPFKRGAFLLASRSEKPIIPIAIIGTYDIMPPKTFYINSTNVKVIIHPPIESKNISSLEEKLLMQRVYSIIEESLIKR
jgi:1-acyl-sn-glycerol-3-phosphate acyltransferase